MESGEGRREWGGRQSENAGGGRRQRERGRETERGGELFSRALTGVVARALLIIAFFS